MIEKLKAYLKEDAKIEEVEQIITEHSEELVKGIDPLAGVTLENVWDFINGNQILKSTYDKKVTEAIAHYKENHFDKDYQERYNKEHPPATEQDKKLRELENKVNETNKLLEEQKKKAERERLKNIAISKTTELLGQDAIKIIDLLQGDSEDVVNQNLLILSEYINGVKKNAVNEILKNNSANPGTGGQTPETNRETLIKAYNEAEERYKVTRDINEMLTMQELQKKLKK